MSDNDNELTKYIRLTFTLPGIAGKALMSRFREEAERYSQIRRGDLHMPTPPELDESTWYDGHAQSWELKNPRQSSAAVVEWKSYCGFFRSFADGLPKELMGRTAESEATLCWRKFISFRRGTFRPIPTNITYQHPNASQLAEACRLLHPGQSLEESRRPLPYTVHQALSVVSALRRIKQGFKKRGLQKSLGEPLLDATCTSFTVNLTVFGQPIQRKFDLQDPMKQSLHPLVRRTLAWIDQLGEVDAIEGYIHQKN